MFKNWKADYYFESVYDISPSFFLKKNICLLFVDLDNTLTGDEDRKQPEQFQPWLKSLQTEGITVVIVSNNKHKERVADFLGDTTIEWYHKAKKQDGILLNKLLKEHQIAPQETAIIGDRVLTDVVAGKKIGATTILTKPISTDKHPLVKYVRIFEGLFKPTHQ